MSEPLPIGFRSDRISFGSDRMKFPGPIRAFPIRFGIADITARATKNFGFAIPGDVHKSRRFIVHHIEDDMPLPMSLAALWIFVPRRILSWKTVNQDVGPAVAVEIVGKLEKIIGIGVYLSQAAFEPGNDFFRAIALFVFESR